MRELKKQTGWSIVASREGVRGKNRKGERPCRVKLQLSHRGQNSGRRQEHKAKNLCMDTIFLFSGVFTVASGHKVTGATAGFSICWTGPFL